MTTTYTNNMFHFEKGGAHSCFVDAYVKLDSDLGRKLAAYKETAKKNMIDFHKRCGLEISSGLLKAYENSYKTVNGTEYVFFCDSEFEERDMRADRIRHAIKRFIKIIERL